MDRDTGKDSYEITVIENLKSRIGEHKKSMKHSLIAIEEHENNVKRCEENIAELEDQLKEYEG